MDLSFEQGPIRPPSEAKSLLLRLTRNCPWNRCAFCVTYKGETFSRRSVAEVKKDIDAVAEICRQVREFSWQKGFGGAVNREVLAGIYQSRRFQWYHVAAWLHHGGKTVFLQDGNSLIMKTADLLEILQYLKSRLPSVERVTSYARSDTLLRKSVEELAELGRAGLSRIHVGMESGSDEVLRFINKGVTARQHIEAGRRVKEAGISLSEYVILGLGGRRWAREHPLETAAVLNAVNPDYIRLRSLAVVEGTPLAQKARSGEFEEQPEEEVVREERLLIERLEGVQSTLVSDHSLNLLEEVNGRLPEDRPAMLAVIDRFLALPAGEKQNFILGKRWGVYRALDDMLDPERHARVQAAVARLQEEGHLGQAVSSLKGQLL
ncbi:MAG: radical SAM protein [Peptococcaceae bacterium]|nr:radical SAM protein [Peptococcaceae bacterium]